MIEAIETLLPPNFRLTHSHLGLIVNSPTSERYQLSHDPDPTLSKQKAIEALQWAWDIQKRLEDDRVVITLRNLLERHTLSKHGAEQLLTLIEQNVNR